MTLTRLNRGLDQIPRQRSRSTDGSTRLTMLCRLMGLFVIWSLGLLLSACDPGRTRSFAVLLDSDLAGGNAGVVIRSNLVENVLSEIDAIALENGFSNREDRLLEQRRYYPATIRYYLRQRAHAPGQITLQVQHDAVRNEVAVYLTEFPSGQREEISEETYAALTNTLSSKYHLAIRPKESPK